MSTKISSRKAKGRLLQNLIAKKISELLDIPYGKDKDIQGREMGQSGTDIKLYGKALELFRFSIECKNCEAWSVPAWIKQAQENKVDGTNWLLICKRNREQPVVVMDVDVFFELYKKILREK